MLGPILVTLGGACGSLMRYAITLAAANLLGERFPWGTIGINVAGSFLIAFYGTLTLPDGAAPASTDLRLLVMVGFCGGFTTFSSFSLQTLALMRGGAWGAAGGNVIGSVLLCVGAAALGHLAAARLG